MIAIIDYNAGNVLSVLLAMERLGYEAVLTNDEQVIQTADKVIFPGVGEASTTMDFLNKSGLGELIKSLKQPVLGVCLGMQLLCESSEENNTTCLGIIPQKVKKFIPQNNEKVPHMGWNTLTEVDDMLLSTDLKNHYAYFVHSYYVELGDYTIGTTHYIHDFSCALRKDNFWATQFHPEKSGSVGETILKNFIDNC